MSEIRDAILESAILELRRIWTVARDAGHDGELGIRAVFRRGRCVRHGGYVGAMTTVYTVSERGAGRLAPEPIPPE